MKSLATHSKLGSLFLLVITVALSTSLKGQTFTYLFSFSETNGKGFFPSAGLVFDRADNLYGTTPDGGTFGCGTVFKVSSAATGRVLTVLRNFSQYRDGCLPTSNLTFDALGNLYGTTLGGGAFGYGNVFELIPGPHGGWNETVLYSFPDGCRTCGYWQAGALIFDLTGNLYGTTRYGGANNFGTVFELSPVGDGTWTEQTIYSFSGGVDGAAPYNGLVFDQSGNLLGTTVSGGVYMGGTAFELTLLTSGDWQKTTIYDFGQLDGLPGSLSVDASGNLYGTAVTGGVFQQGTAFELIKVADGTWAHKILHSFQSLSVGDGNTPSPGPLLFDKGKNLWGTTFYGGLTTAACPYGCGTIFCLAPNSDGTWSEVHFNPDAGPLGGFIFSGGLVFDQHDNLYGTSSGGGTNGVGSVFEFTP